MAELHFAQDKKEASGKVEGRGAPVEAAPGHARRHGRRRIGAPPSSAFPLFREEANDESTFPA